jgi:thiamine pyrophosphate-dependent acetolactate synthase large subunit-like protein
MLFDKPEGQPDDNVAWGSDIAAQMLRRFGFPYISLCPGASYRGLHDSIINHLGNETPSMIVCLHEDHSVAIAHGYAKATGEPMACVLHANIGLLHGMMALYNAWCDRVPMFVLGATGPMDSSQRRPWIDWIHTSADQGGMIRDFVKWDNQPTSPEAMIEAMCRANIVTRSEPTAPVYICLDAGLQEASLTSVPELPDTARFLPPPPPRASAQSLARAVELLRAARKPLILVGRGDLSMDSWNARVKLAERLGACVMTDLRNHAVFPTDHPAHVVAPFGHRKMDAAARQIIYEADVILSLEWWDLGTATNSEKDSPATKAKVISATLDPILHNGAHMNYMRLGPVDVPIAASSDTLVADLLEALGPGQRQPWREKALPRPHQEGTKPTMVSIARELRAAFEDPELVSISVLCRAWPSDVWPFHNPLAYLGRDGGGGLGSGPGIAVGAALGLHTRGRYNVAIVGDGDFCMGASAVWSAARSRIPVLILVNNNRSYFNDEMHQDAVARRRNRPASNRWIGQRIADPEVDIAKLAESKGAVGIGPVKTVEELRTAIAKGVDLLKSGGVCVIDVHIDPGEERSAAATTTTRKA